MRTAAWAWSSPVSTPPPPARRVYACCRRPDAADELATVAGGSKGRTTLHRLDVTDHGQITNLAKELRSEAIDLLLNNAGVYEPHGTKLGDIDYTAWANLLAVNVLAPTRMVECFVGNVERSNRKQIACLSSQMGSIAGNLSGGALPLSQQQGGAQHGREEPIHRSPGPRRDRRGLRSPAGCGRTWAARMPSWRRPTVFAA